jgi:hypothetical protein
VYLIVLLLTWGGLLGRLIQVNYFDRKSTIRVVSLETGIRDLPGDAEWLAIYHQGKKLGYATYALRNLGKDGYRLRSSTQLKTAIAGFKTQIQLVNTVQVDTLFRLRSFDVRLIADDYNTRFKGFQSGDSVYIDHIQGRDSSRFAVYVPQDIYIYVGIQPMLSSQGIKPGQRLVLPSFDPLTMEVSEMEIVHEGKEVRTIQGVEMELNKIRVSMRGIPSYLWLDDNGLTYREESLLGLSLERVTPDQALATDSTTTGLDLIESFAIPVESTIQHPTKLKSLTLEVTGLDTSLLELIQNTRQQFFRSDEKLQLVLRPVPVRMEAALNLNSYLSATPLIQSADARVIRQATEIQQQAGPGTSPVKTLVRWVYTHLEKRPVASLNSTLEILNQREGDCSEHSALFTALSRSLGIPTKIYAGLVYLQGRFLFHAWPVVAKDGFWWAVDPTLGQDVADATHIALLETDFTNLYQLLPLLGNITIKVVDQQY